MWFALSLLTMLFWGAADLFYKKSSDSSDRHSHLRIAVWVGLVMGLSAAVLLPFCEHGMAILSWDYLTAYAPASVSYILSMVIGYAGMRYMEISIISPVQNSSGAMAAVLLTLFGFWRSGSWEEALEEGPGFLLNPENGTQTFTDFCILAGFLFISAGVFSLAVVERNLARREVAESRENKKYRLGALALIFPILYCLLDTVGTAADGVILNDNSADSLGELDVLVLYGVTFFAFGLAAWLFLWLKEKKPYRFWRDVKTKGAAALCEEGGQLFYVFAMASRPVLAAPMVASYCIVSIIGSRFFLREKLENEQKVCVALVVAGVVLFGLAEGLGSM